MGLERAGDYDQRFWGLGLGVKSLGEQAISGTVGTTICMWRILQWRVLIPYQTPSFYYVFVEYRNCFCSHISLQLEERPTLNTSHMRLSQCKLCADTISINQLIGSPTWFSVTALKVGFWNWVFNGCVWSPFWNGFHGICFTEHALCSCQLLYKNVYTLSFSFFLFFSFCYFFLHRIFVIYCLN